MILPDLDIATLAEPRRTTFTFEANREREPLRDPAGQIVGLLIRHQSALHGTIEIICSPIQDELFKLGVTIENHTDGNAGVIPSRDDLLLRSFVSAHTALGAVDGEFVSLLDPPAEFREAATQCRNVGTWPVLAGEEGARNMLLSSPIILYDYPQVARKAWAISSTAPKSTRCSRCGL